MELREAREDVWTRWRSAQETALDCEVQIDDSLTQEYPWGWVFTFVPKNPDECLMRHPRRSVAFHREANYSSSVGTKGLQDTLVQFERTVARRAEQLFQGAGGEKKTHSGEGGMPSDIVKSANRNAASDHVVPPPRLPTMRAEEWRNATQPRPMLEFLQSRASTRKLRLFAVACCRRILRLMVDPRSRRTVEAAERFADGEIPVEEWLTISRDGHRAYNESERVADDIKSGIVREGTTGCKAEAACAAAGAAFYAGHCPPRPIDAPPDANMVSATVAIAVRYEKGIELGVRLPDSHQELSGPMREASKAELAEHVRLIHCIFGDPFRPVAIDPAWQVWNKGVVVALARSIYDSGSFARMPLLGDALEDAGCTDASILDHCRQVGSHTRGCWVVDSLLGKE